MDNPHYSNHHWQGRITLLSPLSHGMGTAGTTQLFNRTKVVQGGAIHDVPILTGNSFRGLLRDCGMRYMMRVLGDPPLTPGAFYLLFSGGTLGDKGPRGLDVDLARQLQRTIPLLGVFGGAVGNQILRGKLRMGYAWLVCRETAHLLPVSDPDAPEPLHSMWDLLTRIEQTRTDDAKNEHLRQLIAPGSRLLMEAKERSARTAEVDTDAGAHQQMRYATEVVAPGAQFAHELWLDAVTDLEYAAFLCALAEWNRAPFLGGKSGQGYGKVRLQYDQWASSEPIRVGAVDLAPPLETQYTAYLHQQAAAILDTLAAVG